MKRHTKPSRNDDNRTITRAERRHRHTHFPHRAPLSGSSTLVRTHSAAKWLERCSGFPCNYRFLSGLASGISQSLLQVQQLLYYCNHGDLFAVWFAVEMYLWTGVGGGSVCVCESVLSVHELWAWALNQLSTTHTDSHTQTHTQLSLWPLSLRHSSVHDLGNSSTVIRSLPTL